LKLQKKNFVPALNPNMTPKFSLYQKLQNGVVDLHSRDGTILNALMKVIYRIELQRDTTNLNEVGPKVVENPKDYALASNFMWSCIGIKRPNTKGVPSDWATHMIGHELTAMYGIDHARTLAAPKFI
jgi:NADP-dependent alcohol dehydrogenase